MENHPIPQDVTGFQFKLIGNMTVKQFAYLTIGIVFAVVLWQLPISFLIKFPFCAFFAILGAGLAFLPVSGRPMDLMIGNYIKALIRPTQFVYSKVGGQIYFPNKAPTVSAGPVRQYKNVISPFPKDKLKAYLESLEQVGPKNKVDEKENNFLMSIAGFAADNISTPQLNLQQGSIPRNPPIKPLINQKETVFSPTMTAQPIAAPVQTVKQTGIMKNIPATPDFPNLITGITRDPRGNALSNILVEIKDKDGNPVRAFKTNEFGRFASATPLINGEYSIEFEDPKTQNKFEKILINATGQIIPPIDAVSIDTREELRRSLFNTN